MEALALEVGDSWGGIEEMVKGLGEFTDAKSPEEEKKLAIVVRYVWETRAGGAEEVVKEDEGKDPQDPRQMPSRRAKASPPLGSSKRR